jgi:hypothetical protein
MRTMAINQVVLQAIEGQQASLAQERTSTWNGSRS